jgi:putative SOS response-associated peptidase YedK
MWGLLPYFAKDPVLAKRPINARAEPAGEDVLKVWQVSKQVNSPRNSGAELLEVLR